MGGAGSWYSKIMGKPESRDAEDHLSRLVADELHKMTGYYPDFELKSLRVSGSQEVWAKVKIYTSRVDTR